MHYFSTDQLLDLYSITFKLHPTILHYFQKVDAKKLEKAEAKLQQKAGKRTGENNSNNNYDGDVQATAIQASTKRETKSDASGNNNTKDIHIEDFDVVCGSK